MLYSKYVFHVKPFAIPWTLPISSCPISICFPWGKVAATPQVALTVLLLGAEQLKEIAVLVHVLLLVVLVLVLLVVAVAFAAAVVVVC